MKKLNLDSIKHDNIINIFDLIVKYDIKISRADIAEKTNLSIMTVGKVVDALITDKILIQSKEIKDSVGRKAGLVMLNPNRKCFIIDLTSYNFCLTIVDFCLKLVDKIVYTYNAEYSYQQNLNIFLKDIKIYFDDNYDNSNYYGIGIILPGKYDFIPEFETIDIKSIIEDIIGFKINCIELDVDASARSILNSQYNEIATDTENIIVHIYTNRQGYIRPSVIFNGTVIHGASNNAGNIGDIGVNELCQVLNNIINLLNPNLIVIECDNVKDPLMEEVVICDDIIRHSHRGLAIKLRKLWFENLL